MKYSEEIILKNREKIIIRNAAASDGGAVLEIFNLTHTETDYLLSYVDESQHNPENEAEFLKKKEESQNEIELSAIANGRVVGLSGISAVGAKYKVRHRAEFGISVIKEYWGLGIGRALMDACIKCAKEAGYIQLELSVVADNQRAISMYKSTGFVEYGRNPKGFNSRESGFQELVFMRLEL